MLAPDSRKMDRNYSLQYPVGFKLPRSAAHLCVSRDIALSLLIGAVKILQPCNFRHWLMLHVLFSFDALFRVNFAYFCIVSATAQPEKQLPPVTEKILASCLLQTGKCLSLPVLLQWSKKFQWIAAKKETERRQLSILNSPIGACLRCISFWYTELL